MKSSVDVMWGLRIVFSPINRKPPTSTIPRLRRAHFVLVVFPPFLKDRPQSIRLYVFCIKCHLILFNFLSIYEMPCEISCRISNKHSCGSTYALMHPRLSPSPSSEQPSTRTDRRNGTPEAPDDGSLPIGKRRLSTWDLITLSISMAGAQIAWTVELGYGTPFLLNLGLSEHLTSLVWLAGPISGLIAQPVIGAVSDSSTSRYRRRFWIILSTAALVISTLTLAYCEPLAAFWVDFLSVGSGDWDETRNHRAKSTAIIFAVISFYVLDFALNGLQASLRNLLLDISPTNQLNAGNAWHSRMTNAGNIIGYGFGFLPLAQLPIIRLIKGSQFRKFCIICIVILVITVCITCMCHHEEPVATKQTNKNDLREILHNIRVAILNLPKPILRVCYVQLFAFMGWFPFLFYSTTYVGQVMAQQLGREPDHDLATRKGELAMLIYSVVGVVAGTVLPHLANRDRRLLGRRNDVDEDTEISHLRETVRQWKIDAARQGKPLKLPRTPFLLRNIWTGALLLFSFLTFMTFFITTVTQATIFISLVGISWAVAMWVPFAIIMELLKERGEPASRHVPDTVRPKHNRTLSNPGTLREDGERSPLIRRRSFHEPTDVPPEVEEVTPSASLAGGTILGIHNLSIVAPQFIVAIINSIIFRIADGSKDDLRIGGDAGEAYFGKNGVAWVLRFGGLCAIFGALATRTVGPTPTERDMRRHLGEMRLLGEEPTP